MNNIPRTAANAAMHPFEFKRNSLIGIAGSAGIGWQRHVGHKRAALIHLEAQELLEIQMICQCRVLCFLCYSLHFPLLLGIQPPIRRLPGGRAPIAQAQEPDKAKRVTVRRR
ncbi:MAG: hypothetical protein OXQ29_16505 [Rhodospirillaceae bacterium]|nr:hypothetical protein [Rhodospirillaceae bacterium]